MTPAFRAIFVAVLLVLSFALPIAAGTLENGIAAYDKGDYETALRLLLANQSNSAAQFLLADMYTKGQGVPQNLVEGISWYRKAADQGGAEAQNRLRTTRSATCRWTRATLPAH
jgi:uncharacterized protein